MSKQRGLPPGPRGVLEVLADNGGKPGLGAARGQSGPPSRDDPVEQPTAVGHIEVPVRGNDGRDGLLVGVGEICVGAAAKGEGVILELGSHRVQHLGRIVVCGLLPHIASGTAKRPRRGQVALQLAAERPLPRHRPAFPLEPAAARRDAREGRSSGKHAQPPQTAPLLTSCRGQASQDP